METKDFGMETRNVSKRETRDNMNAVAGDGESTVAGDSVGVGAGGGVGTVAGGGVGAVTGGSGGAVAGGGVGAVTGGENEKFDSNGKAEAKSGEGIETGAGELAEAEKREGIETGVGRLVKAENGGWIETKGDVGIETKGDVGVETKREVGIETKEDGWGAKGGRWGIKEASEFDVLSELDIARFLRQRRIKLTELAQYCGVSISAISKKIGKNKNMRLESLYQIASVLKVDPREFFFPVERKPVYDLSKVSDIQGAGQTEPLQEVGAEEDVVQKLSPEAFCPHCGSRVRVSVTISKV